MKIKICDLCGERLKSDGELKVKVKRGQATWEGGLIWERLEICADCARIIAEQSREYRRQRELEDTSKKIAEEFTRTISGDFKSEPYEHGVMLCKYDVTLLQKESEEK